MTTILLLTALGRIALYLCPVVWLTVCWRRAEHRALGVTLVVFGIAQNLVVLLVNRAAANVLSMATTTLIVMAILELCLPDTPRARR